MNPNILWTSRTNPKLSAYVAIFGIHDFNRRPLAPPGTKVIVHDKTDDHRFWSPHGTDGRYIGTSMEHYGRVQFFMPDISSIHNVDIIDFFTAAIPFTKMDT